MPYIANTDSERKQMLRNIGVESIEELWKKTSVPDEKINLKNLPSGKSEFEVTKHLRHLASLNASELVNFMGSGYYDHIIPAAVRTISGRSEFYTAYTPYQPEASQGTLQAIYEYQSAICRLTDMPVSNASLYDGGTALFEAMMMAVRKTRRRQAVLSGAVSPIFREMIRCYSSNLDVDLIEIPEDKTLSSNQNALVDAVSSDSACVIVQYPNVFGTVEDWQDTVEKIHSKKALAICSTYPISLSLLKTPGKMGFDIVTGEGQSLGIPLSFGGPYLGFMATDKKLMRKMPVRICGKTLDKNGKTGYVLTLQTREQHIRRAGAMSNICSNENLCALNAVSYLSLIGREGFIKVAKLCSSKAAYTRKLLLEIKGVEGFENQPFFNEFTVRLPDDAGEIISKMIDKGFAAGFPLGRYYPERKNELLVAVTEKRTREEIKAYANALEAAIWT